MKAYSIIYLFLLVPYFMLGQDISPKFKHLTLENGLSQSSISCMLKDSKGFMWFGTEDGLNKYDSKNFTTYRHVPNDTQSLSSSYINALVEQENGVLWVGTNNGLNRYNPDTGKFTRFLHDPKNARSLGNNKITTLVLTSKKQLLIGTLDGLYLFSAELGFTKYQPENISSPQMVVSMATSSNENLWVLSSNKLTQIKLTNGAFAKTVAQHALHYGTTKSLLIEASYAWIGTSKGLIKFDIQTHTTSTFGFYNAEQAHDKRNSVLSIAKGQNDKLWLGTSGGGLISFNQLSGEFQLNIHNPNKRLSLNSNTIRSLLLDEAGVLWIGTLGGGINKYNSGQFKFEHFQNHPNNDNSLSNNGVRALLLDHDDELWVGTHDGLNRINRKTGRIQVYTNESTNSSSISSNIVRSLVEDSKGIIWAGTWHNGLNSFDKQSGKFKQYISLAKNQDALGQVRSLTVDGKDNIWLGANHLFKYTPKTEAIKSYQLEEKNISSTTPRAINRLYFATSGLLWIGTQNGLKSLDTVSNTVKKYLHDPNDPLSIAHNNVTSIAEDNNGSIWLGTYGGGISKLDISKDTFQHYNIGNGLLNDVIYGILIDKQGYLWFTSNAGLGRFNPAMNEFEYFGVDDGIQSKEFNAGAYFKSNKGEFFFGGINGFNTFYPNTINNKKEISRIVFTDFQLLDDTEIAADEVLDKHISSAELIQLNYNQNAFTISFAELNYLDNVDNNYEYQLVGLDEKWHYLGKNQSITLANLDPANYTLRLRVHNDLSMITEIGIAVLTPIWKSNLAFIGYFGVFALFLFIMHNNAMRTKQIRKQFEMQLRNWESGSLSAVHAQNNLRSTHAILPLKKEKMLSKNQKFLERVTNIVEENMEDSSFDVKKFSDEMFISRSQLHRRLKATTGYSTTEFIRLIRLKRAAQMLSDKTASVKEIAFKVGFDNVGYFSKCFKDTFGKPPSQYSE